MATGRRATASVSRQLVLLLSVAFGLVVAVALVVTARVAAFPNAAGPLLHGLQETSALNLEIREGIRRQLELVRGRFEAPVPDFADRLAAIHYELGDKQTRYLRLHIGADERLAVERIKASQSELGVLSEQIDTLLRTERRAQARSTLTDVERLAERMEGDFQLLQELQLHKLKDALGELGTTIARGWMTLVASIGMVVAVMALFVALLRRWVLHPLRSILDASNRLRRGDFSVRAEVRRPDEIGRLAQGFNYMADSLAASHAELERRVEERTRQLAEVQQQLVQAAKLSAVGQLVSGVAHELNNPLTVIMGSAELARGRHREPGDADRRAFDAILSQAERCRKIVAGLTQFARRQEPEREEVDLNRLIDRVLRMREYELTTRNVRLVRQLDPAEPRIAADARKLEQVVLNLLNNACDAVEEKGGEATIWIRTERQDDDRVLFEVRDSGPGIAEPERVFEPFYTTKEVGRGTGLGLSVSYGIVQEHGGELTAENWEGGASFTVILPVGELPAAPQGEANETSIPWPLGTSEAQALVVEDEELLLEMQSSFLADAGIRPFTARSGEEAIRFLERRSVDLVISDVRMPGSVDGVGLYRWVQEHRPELGRRFLLVSGDTVGLEVEGPLDGLPVPCIQKPFTFSTYSQMIHRLLTESGEAAV